MPLPKLRVVINFDVSPPENDDGPQTMDELRVAMNQMITDMQDDPVFSNVVMTATELTE